MPHNGKEETDPSVSRRRYVQAIVAASAAGLAGCNQGGDATGDTNDTENESGTTTRGEPVSDTITTAINSVPQQSQLNRWASSGNSNGLTWVRELVDPRNAAKAKEIFYSGAEFDAPHIEGAETISIPTMLTNFEVEAPYDAYESYNEELTYWDGTPLDAKARKLTSDLGFYTSGGKFTKSMTKNNEVVSQFEYHWWRNKGEVEGQEPNPTNARILGTQQPTEVPFHPGFTESWHQQYEDASSQDAVDSVTSDLAGTNVTFYDLADNGWGSGLYRVESSDDVSAESMTAKLRDDHPNEHATIPNLEIRFATADRQQVLTSRGELDIDGGVVLDEGGQTNREMLPDYIQEIDRFLQSGTDLVAFNWNNKHLKNLWVRRAFVAALDWEAAAVNGWGAGRSVPLEHHTGMSATLSEATFSDEFLDSLYDWPMGKDFELAAKWMRKAGYTKEGGVWTSPEGEAVDLNYISHAGINDWTGFAQTLKQQLESFGFRIGYNSMEGSKWVDALKPDNLNYDIAQMWGGGATNVWDAYWTNGAWWVKPLLGGDPNDPQMNHVDAETTGPDHTHDTMDIVGKPLEVQIPADPKNIDAAPEQAGANPTLSGEAVNIDLADLVHSFRKPDITEEQFQRNARLCARYYNFYLPDFKFHQYTWGLWGNVRDFKFAPRGHPLNRAFHGFSSDDTQVLGGVAQTKFDEEFDAPSR